MSAFQKAVKREAKGRVALIGPAGAGKSYTMLQLAKGLAGADGTIAAIDTEHGSLSKYADMFAFDVVEPDSYSIDSFLKLMDDAEAAGYSVFCVDSLSHFWMGKDGALEFVDNQSKRSGKADSFAGWKDFRPKERAMVDRMIASGMHIICTMRTKNEYVEEVNQNGKRVRRKIGLAPVQREGMEYEFDLVGLMDEDNNLIVDKTRCPAYAGKALAKPGPKEFAPFIEWLRGAPALERNPTPPPAPDMEVDRDAHSRAEAKRKENGTLPMPAAPQVDENGKPKTLKPKKTEDWYATMLSGMAAMKTELGDELYYRELGGAGYTHANEIPNREVAVMIYGAMKTALNDKKIREQQPKGTFDKFMEQPAGA
jgi:hypothetical protein